MAMRMRWMEEEKQEKKSFFLVCEKMLSRAGDDGELAGGVALAVDVGGVLHEQEDALLAKLAEGLEVEGLAVG